ncbi:MAG: phosphoribosyltransferase family protein [Myxococcota bacterium]|nr:phosphoribosyltransferase family protein [Myxococcota bacterium]
MRLRLAATALLDLLLPPRCAGCGRAVNHAPLCPPCHLALPRLFEPPPTPAGLDALVAVFAYRGEVEAWIQRFKYPGSGLAGLEPAPRAVAELLVKECALEAPGLPDRVVPVPLHPRRLRARGFNPAALLARAAARIGDVPCDPVGLRRVRDTPSQTRLDRRARRRNVRGAFVARRPAPARVWLVDDVATTGSTLAACARALRRAGAREVVALCAAATPLGDPAIAPASGG